MIALLARCRTVSPLLALALLTSGCASLTNPVADAVPVRDVPQECLCPPRENEITVPLNLLSLPTDRIYRVATGDVLGIWIEGILGPTNQVPPLHVTTLPTPRDQRRSPSAVGYPVTVEPGGILRLPLIEPLTVRGMTAAEIQQLIRDEYSVKRKLLKNGNERILVSVLQPRQVRVLVLREETNTFVAGTVDGVLPGSKLGNGQIVELGAHENDVLHALTLSGGLPGLDAYNKIYVFRNGFRPESGSHVSMEQLRTPLSAGTGGAAVAIPLRMQPGRLPPITVDDITLHEGDIVFLENREREVYYTGGLLPSGEHVLPRDRSLDVLQAIATVRGPLLNGAFATNNLAGNLIERGIGGPSPSLLLVIRKTPNGGQIPIRVDVNRALKDARERIILQSGDVVLLQEQPNEALARYFGQHFIDFNLTWSYLSGGSSSGSGGGGSTFGLTGANRP
jgi:protein involved in polysaccharide export with SLBB domain